MTSNEVPGGTSARSKLLLVVAAFLFLSAAYGIVLALSDQARSQLLYQVWLVAASAVSATAAFGIWKHWKWGAWVYIGFTVLKQPFLYLMGWWGWGDVIIPGIVIALIMLKYKSLR